MTEPTNPPKRRPGAPKGNQNARKTGMHTAEMKDLRRRLRAWRHRANAAMAEANRLIRAERAAAQGEGVTPKPPKTEKQLSCARPCGVPRAVQP